MAIILPKEGSIWETLGTGLGSGLQALAQGKVQQMQKRNYASSLQQMGLSPDIAYLPEPLQKIAMEQHFSGLSALQKQGLQSKTYDALVNEAQFLGVNPAFIKQTEQSGPEVGAEQLKRAIDIAKKGAPVPGLWQKLMGGKEMSPYLGAKTPLLSAATSGGGVQALQDRADQYKQLLEDPTKSSEEKIAIREEMQQALGGQKSWGETIGGLPVNLLSGAIQSIGSGGGLAQLANLLTPGEDSMFERERQGAIQNREDQRKIYEDTIATADPKSQEYKNARQVLDWYDQGKGVESKAEKARDIPSMADIKEEVVQPIAKMLGMERLADSSDLLNSIVERVGQVGPQILTRGILSGGEVLNNILSSLTTAGLAEGTAEVLGKRIMESPLADTAITVLGYLTSGFRPGAIKKVVKTGYNSFGKLVNKAPVQTADATELAQKLSDIKDQMIVKGAKGNKLLGNALDSVNNKVRRITGPTSTAIALKQPRVSIKTDEAWRLDQELGGDFFKEVKKAGPAATRRLTELREGLRNIYQPWYSKLDPKATEALKNAREIERTLNFKDDIQKSLESAAKGTGGFFSKVLFSLRKGAQGAAGIRKMYKWLESSPAMRNTFIDILEAGAQNKSPEIIAALMKRFNSLAK